MPFSNPEFDWYRLVLLSGRGRRVLLQQDSSYLTLPRICVPRWTRPAKEITHLIRDKWHMQGIVLDFFGDRPGEESIVVVEMLDRKMSDDVPAGHSWGSLDDLEDPYVTGHYRYLLERLLRSGATGRGPFSRLGWINETLDWVSKETAVERSQLARTMEQVNGSADSCLIRFSGGAGNHYWLKATGQPRSDEGRVTVALASLFPQYLPEIIAFHEDWNAWLMLDGGAALSECGFNDPDRINGVVCRLAELQRASLGRIPELLRSGCHDHRMITLRAEISELTPYLEKAMRTVDAGTGARIMPARIRRVAALIEEASYRLEDIGIPDTLMNCDIDLQNVLVYGGQAVFTDWAEASVGNPFVTFEQVRTQFEQIDSTAALVPRLTQTYREFWMDIVPDDQYRDALTLMPLIALACNLCCRKSWLTADGFQLPQSHSFARILTRRMDRAAQVIEEAVENCAQSFAGSDFLTWP